MKQKFVVSRVHPPNKKKNKVVPAKTEDAGVQKETATKQKEKEAKKKKDITYVSLLYLRCIISYTWTFRSNFFFLFCASGLCRK
jgi:hypothetical protein